MTTTDYLQREIRRVELSMRRAAKKPNTPPEELRGLHEKLVHLQEALDAVEEHWRRVHSERVWTAGEPMTLEQLKAIKTMTPIWVEKSEQGPGEQYDHWCLCAGGYIITTGLALVQADKMDGVTFYAYPHAHIDLDKWMECWECAVIRETPGWKTQYKFCPRCGRPLTEEAWAELERRVCGG